LSSLKEISTLLEDKINTSLPIPMLSRTSKESGATRTSG
jgi:hypothetical protein